MLSDRRMCIQIARIINSNCEFSTITWQAMSSIQNDPMCYKRNVHNTFLYIAPILEQTELIIIFDNIITSNPPGPLSAAALDSPLVEDPAAHAQQEA
jgi:hypothetical protein